MLENTRENKDSFSFNNLADNREVIIDNQPLLTLYDTPLFDPYMKRLEQLDGFKKDLESFIDVAKIMTEFLQEIHGIHIEKGVFFLKNDESLKEVKKVD